IKPVPLNSPPADELFLTLLLKAGDNVTTDEIMPAGAKILPLRSNIPAISKFVFAPLDENFARRARESGGGLVVGGENYGQGSSREHAALAPMYLGIRVVLAKSFARIHHTNLVNFGIIPLIFTDEADYDRLSQGDVIIVKKLWKQLDEGPISITNQTQNCTFTARHELSPRQVRIIKAGGLLLEAGGKRSEVGKTS
ncbi:MAG: aconitate hydratase, partial [Firmicutes bacterium]|nr:aconitate hydratase [Bacillota bacterium]